MDSSRSSFDWLGVMRARFASSLIFASAGFIDVPNPSSLSGDDSVGGKSLGFTVYFGGVSYTSVTASTNGFVALGSGFGAGGWSGPRFPVLNQPAIAAVWTDLVVSNTCPSNQSISHGASAVGSNKVDALIASDSPGFTSVGYYVATFQIILTVDASGNTWAVIQYEGLSASSYRTMVAGINDGQGQCSTIYYGTANTEAVSNLANKTYVLDMGLCGGQTCSDDFPYAGFINVPNPSSFSGDSRTYWKPLGFTVYFGGVSYTSVTAATNGFVILGSYSKSGCCDGPQFPLLNTPAIAAVWTDLNNYCGNSNSHGASAAGSSEVDALIASKSPGFTSVGYYVATYQTSYYTGIGNNGACEQLVFQIILTVDASGNTWAVIQYEGLSANPRTSRIMVAGINDGQGQCSTIYYGTANTEAVSNLANKTYVLDMGLCGGQTCSDDFPSPTALSLPLSSRSICSSYARREQRSRAAAPRAIAASASAAPQGAPRPAGPGARLVCSPRRPLLAQEPPAVRKRARRRPLIHKSRRLLPAQSAADSEAAVAPRHPPPPAPRRALRPPPRAAPGGPYAASAAIAPPPPPPTPPPGALRRVPDPPSHPSHPHPPAPPSRPPSPNDAARPRAAASGSPAARADVLSPTRPVASAPPARQSPQGSSPSRPEPLRHQRPDPPSPTARQRRRRRKYPPAPPEPPAPPTY
eukprot:gene21918-28962_t